MRDILCFGTIVLDYVLLVERFPNVNENTFVKRMRITKGGTGANCAVVGSSLGKLCGIVSVVGKDFQSTGYEHYLIEKKIDLTTVFKDESMLLPRCFLFSKGDDQMIFYYEEFEKTDALLNNNIDKVLEQIEHYKVLHFSTGHFDFYHRLLSENRPEKIISFDPGQETFTRTNEVLNIIPYTDILFVNEYEMRKIVEVSGLETIRDLKGPRIIIVSYGEKGSIIHYKEHEIHIPIAKPEKIVDPTGCGDAHRVSFLSKLLEFVSSREELDNISRKELEIAGKFASVVASFIIEAEGAQTNAPTLEKVKERYRKNFGSEP